MDCNKEEAIRAKGMAEKKMQNGEFEGALKIAQKAQQLFPELENISQLITVCDVHCSARKKINGSEMNWYGILQVESLADEVTIKKQYRKLALTLHPDKNKFAGAEAAFKLIGQANLVLSDRGKRSLYDSKCRVPMRAAATKPQPCHVNQNRYDGKQYVPPQQSSSKSHPTFWTSCPFCNMRYQYYRDFVNRALRCQSCSKPFIAYDLGVVSGSKYFPPAFPQQKPSQNQGSSSTVGSQGAGGFSHSHSKSQRNFSMPVGSEPVSKRGNPAKGVGVSTERVKNEEGGSKDGWREEVRSAKVDDLKPKKSGTSGNKSRKRGRKMAVESSESSDAAKSAGTEKYEVIQDNGGNFDGQKSGLNGVHDTRRSSRKRHHVSYNESVVDDNDVVSPPKRSKGDGSCLDTKKELNEALSNGVSKTESSDGFAATAERDEEGMNRKRDVHFDGSFSNRSGQAAKDDIKGAVMEDCKPKASEVGDESKSDSESSCDPDPEYYDCPDTEFHDFEKDKEENCFSVDQTWACYDPADGMPRYYARVRKVFSPGFRLRITWLEPCLEDESVMRWFNVDLPVACGKFVHGDSDETTDHLSFSHQVFVEKGNSRCSYMVYPRKGEVWALFKDWDISWSSEPENHRKYGFEIVEVISDFVKDAGIRVAYLDKVEGFVSVFQETTREGIVSFLILPKELLRFSHRIPSFKLFGTEREGVPKGSFELDPASLPIDFAACVEGKTQSEILDVKFNDSNARSPKKCLTSMKSAQKLNTPKKDVEFEGNNVLETETFKLRRSPRESKIKCQKQSQINGSHYSTAEGTVEEIDRSRDKKLSELSSSKQSTGLSQVEKRLNFPKVASPHVPSGCKTLNVQANDPNLKSPEKGMKFMKSAEKLNTPKKCVGSEQNNDLETQTFEPRRSPRDQKQSQLNASQCSTLGGAVKDLGGAKDNKQGDFLTSRGRSESSRIKEFSSPMKSSIPQSSTKSPPFTPVGKSIEAFHNFNGEKSRGNFQVGHIWALYGDVDMLPKNYAQIKKVESSPFQLHVTMLEVCKGSKQKTGPVCCGIFKLQRSYPRVFPPTAFSHALEGEFSGQNKFEIYPREGQIWALYKNWSAHVSCSDPKKFEYEIVEVLDVNEHCIKVLPLMRLNGFKSVFKAPRSQRSSSGVIEIPRLEVERFSHQIPSFKLTQEKNGRLRGCWELDPASIPTHLFSVD